MRLRCKANCSCLFWTTLQSALSVREPLFRRTIGYFVAGPRAAVPTSVSQGMTESPVSTLAAADQPPAVSPSNPVDLELPPPCASVDSLPQGAGVTIAPNRSPLGRGLATRGGRKQQHLDQGPMQPCSTSGTLASICEEQPSQEAQPPLQGQRQDFLPAELPAETVIEDADSAPRPEDYVYVDGLRLVKPYYFDFKCFVKKRQDGKPLMQLMAAEFPMLSEEYYQRAVATGRLRVAASSSFPNLDLGKGGTRVGKGRGGSRGAMGGGASWDPERPLRAGMCIRHFIHRHEPPVLAGEVQILGITDDFVAVNKPACLPVHTVGQYRKNTVMGVVQAMRPDLWPLYPTYRLDKPVSGVLLLARSSAVAGQMRVLLEERGCSKAYVARVQGVFPDTDAAGGPLVVNVPLGWDAKSNHAMPVPPEVAAAVEVAAAGGAAMPPPMPGAAPLTPELVAGAKLAETHFRRLSVAPDGLTSVVEAVPKTGRTHQIRVHLQYLGHPIANDTQYGGSYGLPLFFRRGMSGPTRPHVNGLRRRWAEEGGSSAMAAPDGSHPAAPNGVEGGDDLPSTTFPGVNHNAQCAEPGTELAGTHKRQRRCDDSLADSIRGNCDGSCKTGECLATAAAAGPAGPNGDAELVAASSERYLQLYTRPEFQVPGGCADPLCPHCPCLVPEGYPIDLEPLYLHAARYATAGSSGRNGSGGEAVEAGGEEQGAGGSGSNGGGWCFEAPLPDWAQPEFLAVPAGSRARLVGGLDVSPGSSSAAVAEAATTGTRAVAPGG
ncbi:hypothetical protein Vretimale_5685 [Volvox reticuliferus]|uniref:Pseudouridine synthase RsuA/RluA-like domain-containing protein n=1 Tax=Volvox reticuliferus TaxID=1737510 RepID=A0A8J4G606_9CHLO|nr:hypothetical protein Vretifemale_5778 [Volvox reticuliferus]GIM00754.1 hypothetical protein Vretimale_5685 [Volvox reticuliferus]